MPNLRIVGELVDDCFGIVIFDVIAFEDEVSVVGVSPQTDVEVVVNPVVGDGRSVDIPKFRSTVESERSRCIREIVSFRPKNSQSALAKPRLPSAFSKFIGFTF